MKANKREKVEITLTMSADEAQFLRDVMGRVSGPDTGRRRYANIFVGALGQAGIYWAEHSDLDGIIKSEDPMLADPWAVTPAATEPLADWEHELLKGAPEGRACSCGMADYGTPGHDGGPDEDYWPEDDDNDFNNDPPWMEYQDRDEPPF